MTTARTSSLQAASVRGAFDPEPGTGVDGSQPGAQGASAKPSPVPTPNADPLLLTVSEAARLLGVDRSTF